MTLQWTGCSKDTVLYNTLIIVLIINDPKRKPDTVKVEEVWSYFREQNETRLVHRAELDEQLWRVTSVLQQHVLLQGADQFPASYDVLPDVCSVLYV